MAREQTSSSIVHRKSLPPDAAFKTLHACPVAPNAVIPRIYRVDAGHGSVVHEAPAPKSLEAKIV
jgi:hypothetical protein